MFGTLGWIVSTEDAQAFLGEGHFLDPDADLDSLTVVGVGILRQFCNGMLCQVLLKRLCAVLEGFVFGDEGNLNDADVFAGCSGCNIEQMHLVIHHFIGVREGTGFIGDQCNGFTVIQPKDNLCPRIAHTGDNLITSQRIFLRLRSDGQRSTQRTGIDGEGFGAICILAVGSGEDDLMIASFRQRKGDCECTAACHLAGDFLTIECDPQLSALGNCTLDGHIPQISLQGECFVQLKGSQLGKKIDIKAHFIK